MAKSLNDRKYASLLEDGKSGSESNINTVHGQVMAGKYTSSAPSLSANDYSFLRVDSQGYLLCKLKSAIEIGGDLAVDVYAFKTSSGTDTSAFVYDKNEDVSGVSDTYLGVGGLDGNADVVRPMPVAVDSGTMVANPSFLPVGGEYRSSATTYSDGDATVLQADVNGRLLVEDTYSGTVSSYLGDIKTAVEATQTAVEIIDDWDNTHSGAVGSDGPLMMGVARDSQETAVSAGDAARLSMDLYGRPKIAGYTEATESVRNEEINPLSDQYVEEELIDTTGTGTAVAYYPSSAGASMGGYRGLSVQAHVTSGTIVLSLEATNDDAASPDWTEVTQIMTNMVDGAACAATETVPVGTDLFAQAEYLNVKKFRVKVDPDDGATWDGQIHIRRTAL